MVVAVDVDREHGVAVTWDDGREGRFELVELRRACPCATCRGRRDRGLAAWPLPGGSEEVAVAGAELVGAWGISFTWSDGHGTGIYPWDSLRRWLDARDAAGGERPEGLEDLDR
jgi:DUF971 family protein